MIWLLCMFCYSDIMLMLCLLSLSFSSFSVCTSLVAFVPWFGLPCMTWWWFSRHWAIDTSLRPSIPKLHVCTWTWRPSGDMDLERRRESASRGSRESEADSGVGVSATERRFAYSLLEKLLEFLDNAAVNMRQMRPSSRFSRRESYSTATEDVKFFGKVCPF